MRGRADAKPNKNPAELAYDKALSLLVRREHSVRELKSKLARRGMEAADSDRVIAELAAKDFQNDERFAEMLVRTRLEGGYGERWIVAELRTHGITEDLARSLINDAAPDWPELVQRQLRRRFGVRPPRDLAERNKRSAFLLRRGFDAATVKLVVSDAGLEDAPDDAD